MPNSIGPTILKVWTSSTPPLKRVCQYHDHLIVRTPGVYILDPSCAQKQLELMQDETKYHVEGCTAWLADGLDLQQSQYVLCSLSIVISLNLDKADPCSRNPFSKEKIE